LFMNSWRLSGVRLKNVCASSLTGGSANRSLSHQRMAALRYGFFIEFLSPKATADLKRLGPCSRRNDDEVSWFVCLPNDYRSIGCGSCISIGGTTGTICDSARGVPGTGAICNPAPSTSGTAGAVPADHGRLSTSWICAKRRKHRRWAGGRLRPSHCARDSTAAQSFQAFTAG
jgi:hypothetical protein